MKKTPTHNTVHKAAMLALAASLTLPACGSPTPWVRVKALKSDCDGPVNLHIVHDPDPKVATVKIADKSADAPSAKRIAFLRDDRKYVQVGFTSGVVCRFLGNEPGGECAHSADSQAKTVCSATLQLVKFEPPSYPENPDDSRHVPKVGGSETE